MSTPKEQIQEQLEILRADMRAIVGSFAELSAFERGPLAMLYHDLNTEVLMMGGAVAAMPDEADSRCYPLLEGARNLLKFMKEERLQILCGEETYPLFMQKCAPLLLPVTDHAMALLQPIADTECQWQMPDIQQLHGQVKAAMLSAE